MMASYIDLLIKTTSDITLKEIAEKVKSEQRISDDDCLLLFNKATLDYLGVLANHVR